MLEAVLSWSRFPFAAAFLEKEPRFILSPSMHIYREFSREKIKNSNSNFGVSWTGKQKVCP
jgi:hypothetical protein